MGDKKLPPLDACYYVQGFENTSFESMVGMVMSADSGEIIRKGEALTKAKGEFEKIGNLLKQRAGNVTWEGEGGNAFREWGDDFAKQVLKMAEMVGNVGSAMETAGGALGNAKTQLTSMSSGLLTCYGDADKEKARLEKVDKARDEALPVMYKLASYYLMSENDITAQASNEPVFKPLPDSTVADTRNAGWQESYGSPRGSAGGVSGGAGGGSTGNYHVNSVPANPGSPGPGGEVPPLGDVRDLPKPGRDVPLPGVELPSPGNDLPSPENPGDVPKPDPGPGRVPEIPSIPEGNTDLDSVHVPETPTVPTTPTPPSPSLPQPGPGTPPSIPGGPPQLPTIPGLPMPGGRRTVPTLPGPGPSRVPSIPGPLGKAPLPPVTPFTPQTSPVGKPIVGMPSPQGPTGSVRGVPGGGAIGVPPQTMGRGAPVMGGGSGIVGGRSGAVGATGRTVGSGGTALGRGVIGANGLAGAPLGGSAGQRRSNRDDQATRQRQLEDEETWITGRDDIVPPVIE
ncbi:hypothetical protein LRS74_08635 [Streptomyces sp. LX-29]|uniref:WXG100 family type VII secretion target n=1 Tax=Streptomyces sp. LX-29 TaxID=2900152 RepID=UPI00240E349B|nr:hypothetical protein [Streptomyces sp. LX-29]WFB11976.1 hypothetical protein LRS74_08635 [Streptomyces sp. LX-29]